MSKPEWHLIDPLTPLPLLQAALAPKGETIKSSPVRTLRRISTGQSSAILKEHHRSNPSARFAHLFKLDPAHREASALTKALGANLPVPHPLATHTSPGGISRLLLEDLGPTISGRQLVIAAQTHTLTRIGQLLGQMHMAGLIHNDLHIDNIVEAKNHLFLLDLQAAKFCHAPPSPRRRLHEILNLWLSIHRICNFRQGMRMLKSYLRTCPWTASSNLARKIAILFPSFQKQAWRRREDRPFRNCSEFTHERMANLAIYRVRWTETPSINEVMAILNNPKSEVIRQGRRGFVRRGKGLIIKERDAAHARALWLNQYRLRQRDIPHADGLLLLLEGDRGMVVTRDLHPLPHLDEAMDSSPAQKDLLISTARKLAAKFHYTGLRNRDLKCPNLLVAPGPEIIAIDLDGVSFPRRLTTRMRNHDLARLEKALGAR